MNTSTEHILQCNQSEPLADASGRIVDLMNENGSNADSEWGSSSPRHPLTFLGLKQTNAIMILNNFTSRAR